APAVTPISAADGPRVPSRVVPALPSSPFDGVIGPRGDHEPDAARTVGRASADPGDLFMAMTFDPRMLWLIVHDLRNPLNVIALSVRILQDTLPKDDPSVQEDLGFLGENVRQLDRMLAQLGDFSRLNDDNCR